MEFGFTNDRAQFEAAVAWRQAAITDGWTCEPTYGDHEPASSAATLKKDGFQASVLSREKRGKWLYEAKVNLWGPDGLCVLPPLVYSWETIVAGLRRCMDFKKEDVDTSRAGFAGRYCKDCLPKQKKLQEYRGWTN